MAEKIQPVFRDFLGTDQRAELSVTDSARISQNSTGIIGHEDGEDSTRACSEYSGPRPPTGVGPLPLPNSLDSTPEILWLTKVGVAAHQGSVGLSYKESEHDHGKKREILVSRNSIKGSLHLSSEAMENSRPSKCSRFKEIEDPRKEPGDPSSLSGDLRLSMQPPRPSLSAPLWMQTLVFKSVLSTGEPSRPASLNSAVSVGRRLNPVGSCEKAPPKENIVSFSSLPQPPADEGSRTGLQGAGIAHLIDACPATLIAGNPSAQGAAPSHSKAPSQNTLSDCPVPSLNKIAAPTTRQLTIFYGGQAHVFDDISAEKADAIMLLAGSNGISWSTTYAHRPSISNHSAASECLELERQKEKPASCEISVNRTESHALPSDVQSLLQGLACAGVGHVYSGHQFPRQALTSARPSAGLNAPENLADASNLEGSVMRMPSSPAAYTNSTGKEPGNQNHQWM